MKHQIIIILSLSLYLLCSCSEDKASLTNNLADINSSVLDSLKQIASTEGFKPYEGNPVLRPGAEGTWDEGALGSMSVLKVGEVFHMYYESPRICI